MYLCRFKYWFPLFHFSITTCKSHAQTAIRNLLQRVPLLHAKRNWAHHQAPTEASVAHHPTSVLRAHQAQKAMAKKELRVTVKKNALSVLLLQEAMVKSAHLPIVRMSAQRVQRLLKAMATRELLLMEKIPNPMAIEISAVAIPKNQRKDIR